MFYFYRSSSKIVHNKFASSQIKDTSNTYIQKEKFLCHDTNELEKCNLCAVHLLGNVIQVVLYTGVLLHEGLQGLWCLLAETWKLNKVAGSYMWKSRVVSHGLLSTLLGGSNVYLITLEVGNLLVDGGSTQAPWQIPVASRRRQMRRST